MSNEISRTEFLTSRRKGLGGSDMAAIFGESKWRSRRDIWLDKTERIGINDEPNPMLDMNSYLEGFVVKEYERISGNSVQQTTTFEHKEYPFMRANIDGLIIGDKPGILEIKSLNPVTFNKIKNNGLTADYIFQIQHYFLCTNYTWGEFALLDKMTGKLLIFPVEPDQNLMDMILKEGIDFWNNYILADVEPAEKKITYEFKEVGGIAVDLSSNKELAELLSERDEIQEMIGQTKELKDTNDNAIKDSMQDIEVGEIGGIGGSWRIHYSHGKPRVTLNAKAIEKELPEVYEKYKKESKPTRTLKVFKIGQEK